MSLKYIARIENDSGYHIERNFRLKELLKLDTELQEAEQLIKEYRTRIAAQYNKATQAVEHIQVLAFKDQNKYSSDKKVKIVVQVRKLTMFEGAEVSNEWVYGTNKDFGYHEQKEAKQRIKELLKEYPGATYTNNTTYKKMEV